MSSKRRLFGACVGVVAAATALAACSSSSGGGGGGKSSGNTSSTTQNTNTQKGGTLYYNDGTALAEHFDPQRVYIGRDIDNMERLWYRTLDEVGTGPTAASNKLYPDLGTTTGVSSNNNKTWKWTLKTGIKWQDGTPVTCEDVKYGVSRTFAQDIITGGPSYALQFLNIPATPAAEAAKSGFATLYHGPYHNVGVNYYNKAVTCSGQTITFNLKKPIPDFNYTVTLPAFGPFEKSKDQGAKSNYIINSDGPYMLQPNTTWQQGKGATLVRNPEYNPKTDNTTIRRALPDKYVFTEGTATATLFSQLIADSGNAASMVTDRSTPPALLLQAKNQGSRFTDNQSPFVFYLTPNFKNLTNPKVREALAVSTNRAGALTAEGGEGEVTAAYGLVPPNLGSIGGYKPFKAFNVPDSGDPAMSKQLLASAGVKTPYPITFTYQDTSPVAEKFAAALQQGWDAGGFKVTLNGLTSTYYDVVQTPSNASKYDITEAGWGPDWASASTVIPPLFDSRVNLSTQSNGSDYGLYSNSYVNSQIDKAYNTTDATARNAIWESLDEFLAKDVAYIPVYIELFPRLHGSKVTNYVESASLSNFPDLGQIGVSS